MKGEIRRILDAFIIHYSIEMSSHFRYDFYRVNFIQHKTKRNGKSLSVLWKSFFIVDLRSEMWYNIIIFTVKRRPYFEKTERNCSSQHCFCSFTALNSIHIQNDIQAYDRQLFANAFDNAPRDHSRVHRLYLDHLLKTQGSECPGAQTSAFGGIDDGDVAYRQEYQIRVLPE